MIDALANAFYNDLESMVGISSATGFQIYVSGCIKNLLQVANTLPIADVRHESITAEGT